MPPPPPPPPPGMGTEIIAAPAAENEDAVITAEAAILKTWFMPGFQNIAMQNRAEQLFIMTLPKNNIKRVYESFGMVSGTIATEEDEAKS